MPVELSQFRRVATVLGVLAVGLFLYCAPARAGSLGSANFFHGFHVPNGGGESCSSPGSTENMSDMLSGDIGADIIRVQCYWSSYETGPGEYSTSFLEGLLNRARNAQANSGNANIRLLVNLDLGGWVEWMDTAGYALASSRHESPYYRYYPTSVKGLEAYGRAMAKILKYLHSHGVSAFIETPNEPDVGGPSDPIPAEKVGQMAGQAVSFAALEGLQLNNQTGPAILVGSVLTNGSGNNLLGTDWSTGKWREGTDAEYFWEVQQMTDYTIEQWWKEVPGGPAYANTLMGTWRPSFHAYPHLGETEETPCSKADNNLQDHKGDRTGAAALTTIEGELVPLLETIDNGKRWWLTETGMTSFKTNPAVTKESSSECKKRREEGGDSYGKSQQSEFYKSFVAKFNERVASGNALWNRFEGVAFFWPQDFAAENSAYAGFGVHWPAAAPNCGLPYPCQKPAAVTFNQYYSDAESLPPSGWTKENIGPNSNCGGSGEAEPAISSWGPGRLDLFVCGTNKSLWHRWWEKEIGWSAWENLGGVLTSPPSAVSWGKNRIDVVARAQYGETYHWAWNGSSWSSENIGGAPKGAPCVSSRGVGYLSVFERGGDDALWVRSLNPGTGWTAGWVSLGGGLSSAPACVSWGSSRIDVVVRGTSGDYWLDSWNGTSWSWENLGGSFSSPPAIASRGEGKLDVFGRGTYGDLWIRSLSSGSWGEWVNMGGYTTSGPSAVAWGPNRLDVVNSSEGNSIAHWFWGE